MSEQPALQACELSLDLGRRRVVDGVSASLQAGQWVAIVGPNGAGKSSLLSMLAGLRKPAAGSVQLHGRPLVGWPLAQRARAVAWLAQLGEAEGEMAARDVVLLGRTMACWGRPAPSTRPPWTRRWRRPNARPSRSAA